MIRAHYIMNYIDVQHILVARKLVLMVVIFILIGFFLFSASVYNYSFGRLLFVSGLDRHLPTVISRVNANRVP